MKDDTTDQPFVDNWPMYAEAYSKFPVLADIKAARVKLARRFNARPLPKATEVHLAWQEHQKMRRR
jgi:hypothetical protein